MTVRQIDISPTHLALVKSILSACLPANARVLVFGSRARGTARQFSDLDLAIDAQEQLSLARLAKLADAFEESLLPYKVDVIDVRNISDDFRRLIESEFITL